MTVRDRASLISEANADIPDNVAGLVSPADIRKSIIDLADSARLAQDLGNSATLNVGTTSGTVAAGDDPRIAAIADAVPNTRQVTTGTGLTGGGDLTANRSLAIDKATDANVHAAASNKVLTTDLINSASTPVTLTDATTIAVNWNSFVTSNLVVTDNRTIGNPTNVQTGTSRIIRIVGSNATERSLSFAANYKGPLPEDTVSSTKGLLISLFAATTTEIHITWKVFEL
jgi:hypothetical protein